MAVTVIHNNMNIAHITPLSYPLNHRSVAMGWIALSQFIWVSALRVCEEVRPLERSLIQKDWLHKEKFGHR